MFIWMNVGEIMLSRVDQSKENNSIVFSSMNQLQCTRWDSLEAKAREWEADNQHFLDGWNIIIVLYSQNEINKKQVKIEERYFR